MKKMMWQGKGCIVSFWSVFSVQSSYIKT